jgi:carbonic anhydrase
MEGHFVHMAADGSLAVIGVMYQVGEEENKGMRKIWKQMPAKAGEKTAMASQVKAEELMPKDRDYYRFNGSLTLPPVPRGYSGWL